MTAPAIVPKFDDDATTGRKLAIICSKGNLDMVYPGLVLANAALGEGVETHLFFTFWGFDIITRSRMGHLKFTPLGNTAITGLIPELINDADNGAAYCGPTCSSASPWVACSPWPSRPPRP